MMPVLTNREIAILIWLVILAVLFGRKKEVRKSFAGVLGALFNKHLVRFFLLLLVYTGICLYLLSLAHLWGFDQWKSTLLWVLFAATASAGKAITEDELPDLLKSWIADSLKLTVVLEFIAGNYTFSLPVEMVFVPALACVGILAALAGSKQEYAPVKKLLDGLLVIVGIWLFAHGIFLIVENWNDFAQLSTLRDFYTVPLLALVFIPFAYAVHLFARYEQALSVMRVFVPDKKLRDYAIASAMIAFGPRVNLLRRWSRSIGSVRFKNRSEVQTTIREVLSIYRREQNPVQIDEAKGWCPIKAGMYLDAVGLATNDYHSSYGDWFSASPMRELNKTFIPDNIAYYVEGNEAFAETLKIKLNINTQEDEENSKAFFIVAATILVEGAIGAVDAKTLVQKALASEMPVCIGSNVLRVERDDFPNKINRGYSLLLTLKKSDPVSRDER